MRKLHALILALFCAASTFAADRIAVAEIMTRGNIDAAGLAGLADQIEAKLGGNYEVISRTALQAMLKEVAFQTESGLADSAGQLAELGRVHGVKYLLVTSVARIGSRMGMTLMVVDCSTGKVDPKRHVSLDAPDLDGLIRQLDRALDKIGLLARPAETDTRKQLALFPVQVATGIAADAGNSFGTKLSEFLLKSGSFELLSREALKAVAAESALADAALAAPGQQIKTGALAVGDWLILPKLTRMELQNLSSGTAIAGTSTRTVATLEAELRIIEVKSGTVVAVEQITCRRRSNEIPAETRRDWTAADYRNDLLSLAAETAARKLLERRDPVLVAAVEGNTLYLTRGEGAGMRAGQIYEIYQPGKPVVHPKTGRVLGSTEKRLGEARIESVTNEMSTASWQGKGELPAVGARCRLKADPGTAPAPAAPPAYPMATP